MAGAAKQFIPPMEFKDQLSAVLNVTDICNGELWKVSRILRKGQIYHSEEYTRVKKRNSYTVLLLRGTFASIKYFLWHKPSGNVLAVYKEVPVDQQRPFLLDTVGSHLIRVKKERQYQFLSFLRVRVTEREVGKDLPSIWKLSYTDIYSVLPLAAFSYGLSL